MKFIKGNYGVYIQNTRSNRFDYKKVKDNHHDLIDQILILNYIFSLNKDYISNILIKYLLCYLFVQF